MVSSPWGVSKVEAEAYGTSLYFFGRRGYVMAICAVMSLLCWIEILRWIYQYGLITNFYTNKDVAPVGIQCHGFDCYEVFSCRGFTYTTEHIRQPLITIVGAMVFPLGINACLHGFRFELRLVALWLVVLTGVLFFCLWGDLLYYQTCDAYPGSTISQTLLWPIPFPITKAQQDQLATFTYYPRDQVDKVTDGFHTMFWYFVYELCVWITLAYTAWQARTLGMLFERGALGLGVHYGLGQFDEVLNHETIKNRKKTLSMFLEDAKLPRWNADLATPLAFNIGHDYSTLHTEDSMAKATVGKTEDEFEAVLGEGYNTKEKLELMADRSSHYEEILKEANKELRAADEAYTIAVQRATHERESERWEEEEAMEAFKHHEMHKEAHQEHRAEELAEEKALEAEADAREEGLTEREIAVKKSIAYQRELSNQHDTMLHLAVNRTKHEHYRHAEREKRYKMERVDTEQTVEVTKQRLDAAKVRVADVKEQMTALDKKEESLLEQNVKEDVEQSEKQKKDMRKMFADMAGDDVVDEESIRMQSIVEATEGACAVEPQTLMWSRRNENAIRVSAFNRGDSIDENALAASAFGRPGNGNGNLSGRSQANFPSGMIGGTMAGYSPRSGALPAPASHTYYTGTAHALTPVPTSSAPMTATIPPALASTAPPAMVSAGTSGNFGNGSGAVPSTLPPRPYNSYTFPSNNR